MQQQKPCSMKSIDRHEAPSSTSAAATAKAAAAAASARRKVHVVYYLNRGGHVDQPHLIEGSIATGDNLYLKDFKRWLAMARGSSMPGTFSWAYKRNYGRGGGFFIWHDVFDDDDPIFPLQQRQYLMHFPAAASSNTTAMAAAEYVLMGSEMPNNNNNVNVSLSPPAAAQLPFGNSCSVPAMPNSRGGSRHAELLVPCRKEIILSTAATAASGERVGNFETATNIGGFDCRSGVDRHRGSPLADGSCHRPSLELCASTPSQSRPAAASYWRCQDIDVVPAAAAPLPPEHYHGSTSYGGGIFASGSARSDSGSFVYSYRASVHSRDSGCDADEHLDVVENEHEIRAETPAALRAFKAVALEKVSDAATQTGSADSRRSSTDGSYAYVGVPPSNAADSPPMYAVKSCSGGEGGGPVVSTRDRRNYALDQEVLNRSSSSASAADYRQLPDGTVNTAVRCSSASLTEQQQSFGNVDDGCPMAVVPTHTRSQRLPSSNPIHSRSSNSQRLQLPMPSGDECPIDRGASFTAAATSSCRNRQQQQPAVVSGRNSGGSCTAEAAEVLYSAGSSSLYNGSTVLETCTASPSSARSFRSMNSGSQSTRFSGSYNGEGGGGYDGKKGGGIGMQRGRGDPEEVEMEMQRARARSSSKGKVGRSMVRWEVLQQLMLFRCSSGGGGRGGTAAAAAEEETKKRAEDRNMMKRSPSSVKPSKSPLFDKIDSSPPDVFHLGLDSQGHNTTTAPSPSPPSYNISTSTDHLPCPYNNTTSTLVLSSSSSPSSLTSYPSLSDLQNSCLGRRSDRQISYPGRSDRQNDGIFMPPPPPSPSHLTSTAACFRSWFCPQFYPTFKSHHLPPQHHPSQLVPPNLIHKHGLDLLMPIASTPTSTTASATVSPCDPLQDLNSSEKLLHLISSPLVDTKYNCP